MQRSASVVAVLGSSHEAQEGTGGAKVNWDNDRSLPANQLHTSLLNGWMSKTTGTVGKGMPRRRRLGS